MLQNIMTTIQPARYQRVIDIQILQFHNENVHNYMQIEQSVSTLVNV